MKFTLFAILLCIFFDISAQTEFYKDGKGFNSCFQKLDKGCFSGYADGLLQFEYNDGTMFLASFSKDSAHLEIVPDPYKIYDVSYKNYMVKNDNIQIKYSTYSLANALFVTIGGKKYTLSLFDGACWGVINGLDYEYILNRESELLIIHFSDRVGLCASECYTSPEFYIQKGSTLIFYIKN